MAKNTAIFWRDLRINIQAKAQADWILPSLQALPDVITEASHLQLKES